MEKKLFFLLILFSLCGKAQNQGDIVQNFGSEIGFNNGAHTIKLQEDGKILVGGYFTTYKGVSENRIIRLNPDGTKDTSFITGVGFNGYVGALTIQSDGKILVGGNFTTYKGVSENRIIRLNPDGTKDTSFITGIGFNGNVAAITIQSDGKILVGGNFTTYKGVSENRIIRLNPDGTKDISFNTGIGFNGSVSVLKLQVDGKILSGGYFTTYKGVAEKYIIRLNTDGSKDLSFISGTGFDNNVITIETQVDSKILVGGNFTNYNGVSENKIIRLNTDGSKDLSFNTGTGFDNYVNSILSQADGKIILGGEFTTYKGVSENKIIRLNSDGTKDDTFNTGTGFYYLVVKIISNVDGKIIICGNFNTFNNVTVNGIVKLNSNGIKDSLFNMETGFNDDITKIVSQADGKLLVGGIFNTYKGVNENRIIRLNIDGTKDNTFYTGTGFNGVVYTIALQIDGKVLIGGSFSSYNNIPENNIIRLNSDGSKDLTFNCSFNGVVRIIELQSDGKILVGGSFITCNGVTENKIIRLNSDGTKDTFFNSGLGFNGDVKSLFIQSDGKILVGGDFTTYKGVAEKYIIRLNHDGTKDTTFNIGLGFNGNVNTLFLQADGKILVGGWFTNYNGVSENYIIRLNSDGSKDTSFNTGIGFNNAVQNLLVQTDGKIIIGGYYSTFKGLVENNIIRLNSDGTKDLSLDTGIGFNNGVYTIAKNGEGKIFVGGSFTSYKGYKDSVYLIGLHSETSLETHGFYVPNELIITPNPVKDVLMLKNSYLNKIYSLKIYDIQGKLILESSNINNNVSHFSKGLYLVKILTVQGEITKKLIKE